MRKRLIAILVASCSTAAFAGEPGWIVSESSGPVQVGHGGMSRVATRGLGVALGDTVTTGAAGRAVLVRGTEYMMVAANSRLRLPVEPQAVGFTKMFEDFGNVVFMIKKKTTPHFEVKTPYLAAVVKGTTFSVGVTAAGASVQVLEGAIDVATSDGGAHELLRPGSVAIVGAGDLFRMRIESNGVAKLVASPAAPTGAATTIPPAPKKTLAVAMTEPKETPAITVAVYEAPVSLATVTGGLIGGTIGGVSDVAEVVNISRVVTEASSSAVKAVASANTSIAAGAASNVAAAVASTQSQAAESAAQAKSIADQTAATAAIAAQQAADATARANADKASSAAASSPDYSSGAQIGGGDRGLSL